MYYKLENNEFERIKEVEKITFSDYELVGDFIPVESMICAIEDLLVEYQRKGEELKDLQQDIENNYELKQENPYIDLGLSERDFL